MIRCFRPLWWRTLVRRLSVGGIDDYKSEFVYFLFGCRIIFYLFLHLCILVDVSSLKERVCRVIEDRAHPEAVRLKQNNLIDVVLSHVVFGDVSEKEIVQTVDESRTVQQTQFLLLLN